MKIIKALAILSAISFFYFLFWLIGTTIGTTIFPNDSLTSDANSGTIVLMLFLAGLCNSAVIQYTISQSRLGGWKLFQTIALQIFAIQFFLSQIETLWFNSALQLPLNLIYAIVFGGLLTAIGTSFIAITFTDKLKNKNPLPVEYEKTDRKKMIIRIALLSIIIYPLLYILAGHFIAWQFEPLRMHYTGSAETKSFFTTMTEFVTDGLWPWQIFRGLLWIAVAWPVLKILKCGFPQNGVILGLLFAVLMNAQHLIPNPYMPGLIPLVHAVETASSNFIWGFAVAWMLAPKIVKT